jgi:hypothetical protein
MIRFLACALALASLGCGGDDDVASNAGSGGGSGGSGGSAGASGTGGASGGTGGTGGSAPITPPWCGQPSVDAASCERADVASAIDGAAEGATVNVPAGTCVWTSPITITKAITLAGAGETETILQAGDSDGLLDVDGAGGAFRLTGVGFTGNTTGPLIALNGSFNAVRIDHVTFTNIHDLCVLIGYFTWYESTVAVRALFDHVTYVNDEEHGFVRTYGSDDSWNQPDALGSDDAIFIEDSSFAWNVSGPGPNAHVNDGEHGARIVIRHNQIQNGQLQWHDTGSTQQARSTRVLELYGNTFQCDVDNCGWGAIGLRGGTGVAYDNLIPIYPGGYENAAVTQIYRVDAVGSTPWPHQCDGTVDRICSTFRSHCSGGDHRDCGADGNECNGMGTCVDTCNSDTECPSGSTCLEKFDGQLQPSGWPCRDQTGRGQDDPVTHEQASAPFYWWQNTESSTQELLGVEVTGSNAPYIQADRDFYIQVPAFDGHSGMGRGDLSARPPACTPGVAYFAVDENKLYKCSEGNQWSVHFQPFAYPHPLAADCQ